MADQRIVLEFIGDPRGLKPAVDALQAIGKLTKDQIAEFNKITDAYAKEAKAIQDAKKEQEKLTHSVEETGEAIDDLGGKANKLPPKIKEGRSEMGKMLGSVKKLAVAMGIAFGIQQITQFISRAVKLAAAAEGVRIAFKRIGSEKLLEGLNTAVKGTVSEVELMKQAVRANNFKIPLEDLGNLFEFARRRAKETGESVDYLVNSIVLGIGRKSPLILDNLGISAVELRKRLGGVSSEAANIGDISRIVGQIATDEMVKMGTEITTTNDLLQRGSAAWEDQAEKAGQFFIKVGTGWAWILGLMPEVDHWQNKVNESAARFKVDKLEDLRTGYSDLTDIYKDVVKQLAKVKALEAEKAALGTSTNDRRRRKELIDLIKFQEGYLKVLREVFEEEKKRQEGVKIDPNAIKNVFYYEQAIKNLNEEIKAEGTTLERTNEILEKRKELQKELDALTEKQAKDTKETVDRSIRSFSLLNLELGELTEAFEKSAIGTSTWLDAQRDVVAKTEEIAKEMGKLRQMMAGDDPGLTLMPSIDITGFQVDVRSLEDTLEGLGILLSAANQRKVIAPEWSDEYRKAKAEVDRLTERIENFGVKTVDVNKLIKASTKDVTKEFTENWELTIDQIGSGMSSMFRSINQISQRGLEYEMQQLDDQLEKGAISRENYDDRRRSLERRRVQDAKTARLFEAIINTATAVTSALASYDYASAILFGIVGGLEIGVIASEPIPQFAKGTKDAPAGFKWVGEEGPELTYDKGGYPIITNGESKILANDPYSPQARAIMKKYDIPQLHTGLFNNTLRLSPEAQMAAMGQSRGFDYDRLATALANKLMFQDRNMLQMMQKGIRVEQSGFQMMVEAMKTKTRGGYV